MIDVVCALLFTHGKVLIAQRSERMQNPLKWEFPGGKIHPGETAFEAIKRECHEELSLHVAPLKTGFPVVHHYPHISIKLVPVVCAITGGSLALTEHQAFAFVLVDELQMYALSQADSKLVEANPKLFTTGG